MIYVSKSYTHDPSYEHRYGMSSKYMLFVCERKITNGRDKC